MTLSISSQGIASGSFGSFTAVMVKTAGSNYFGATAIVKNDESGLFDFTTLMPSSGGAVGISGLLPAFSATPTFNIGTIGTAATAANQASQITQETAIATGVGTPADAAWTSGSGTEIAILKNIATNQMQASGGSVSLSGLLPAYSATPTFNIGTLGGGATAANQALSLTQETISASALGTPSDTAWVSGSGSIVSVLKKIATGGGSAVTISDGSDATLGSQADAAWSGSGSGTEMAVLKAIYAQVAGLPDSTPVAAIRSTALEASHVFKSSAGSLIDTYCLATVSGFYMLFDATSVPADGAVTPLGVIPVGAFEASSFDLQSNYPLSFTTGLVGVFSTTGPFTKTASAMAFMSARIQ
jgi:hypothetical protein